ncbi:MAG: gamma-glutamylcyclotransferase family protein [Prochlorothrix sp.]
MSWKPSHFTYFAYGSNLLTQRLTAGDRCPSATPLTTGFLAGHCLMFHKLGRDGSGKCDVLPTGNLGDRVYGAVFRIAIGDRQNLDRVESLGIGYRAVWVTVQTPRSPILALAYRALQTQDNLLPFEWYRQLVIAGAQEHRLPTTYLNQICQVPSIPDPDPWRHQHHINLLTPKDPPNGHPL